MKRVFRLFPLRHQSIQAEHLSKHYAKSSDGRTIIRLNLSSFAALLMPYESLPANFGSDFESDSVPLVLNLNQDLVDYLFARLMELDEEDLLLLLISIPSEVTNNPDFSPAILKVVIHQYFASLEITRCENLRQLARDAFSLGLLGTGAMGLSVLLEANSKASFAVPLVNQGVTVFGWLTFWEALANALWNWRPLYKQMRMCQRIQEAQLEVEST